MVNRMIREQVIDTAGVESQNGINQAGSGVYAVTPDYRDIVMSFLGRRFNNESEFLAELKLVPGTRVVDISSGEGKRVFEAFASENNSAQNIYDDFCKTFRVEILKFTWTTFQSGEYRGHYSWPAYLIKNPDAIQSIKRLGKYPRVPQRNG